MLSNPPYGHVESEAEREQLTAQFPALLGGEVDRYAAFLLRALELVRPGGAVALLIPDTWMFLARAGRLREAVIAQAEVAAIADLGKPFAAAKDTRVQAIVLVRKPATVRAAFVVRGVEALAQAPREELHRTAHSGWFVYRTPSERDLCEAIEDASVPLGRACDVGYGMRTGNNARHVGRRPPRPGELGVVGGEDIVPYSLRWRPKTLLHREELEGLVARQLGRAKIGVQRIRTNAQAPWARWLEAAPVGPEMLCLDSLSTLSCESPDRLWALLALVSSVAMQRHHRLRTTDVNVKPSALRELPVPRSLLEDPRPLAALARERALARDESAAQAVDRRIDAQVYALFGLRRELVEACERGFWGDRFAEEIQRLGEAMSDPSGTVARKEGTA